MSEKLKKADAEKMKGVIISSYNAGNDYRAVGQALGLKINTINRWIREGMKTDTRGGSRVSKIQQQHKDFFVECIEDNPRITLHELTLLLDKEFNLSVSKECIRQHLDGMIYSLKDVKFVPETANNAVNKTKRKEYVSSLLNYQSQCLPIVYIDECNFNLHISRTQGRSKKGTRCNVPFANTKGANIHLIGGISQMGRINFKIKRGSFTKESAYAWVKETLVMAKELFRRGPVILVLDNAPAHSQIELVLQEENLTDCKILRLGPYSPMLNPIEKGWSKIKAYVKREMTSRGNEVLSREVSEISMRERRCRLLESIILESITCIDVVTANNLILGVQNLFTDVIDLKDVEF